MSWRWQKLDDNVELSSLDCEKIQHDLKHAKEKRARWQNCVVPATSLLSKEAQHVLLNRDDTTEAAVGMAAAQSQGWARGGGLGEAQGLIKPA